jgi:hypothetical protein
MSDLVPKISIAIENFKARQQDIIGLGHSAYKDLFLAANTSLLTSVVQSLLQQSYAETVNANSPRTSLIAAVSQQHGEIMAGCRVLTSNEEILRALIDAANAATTEAFCLIYAERPKIAPVVERGPTTRKRAAKNSVEPAPEKRIRRTVKKSIPKDPV